MDRLYGYQWKLILGAKLAYSLPDLVIEVIEGREASQRAAVCLFDGRILRPALNSKIADIKHVSGR